jgi:hypothetical protein
MLCAQKKFRATLSAKALGLSQETQRTQAIY